MTFDKSRLPSRHVTVGPERAPHRSYYYAMGLTADDIAKPFVGVVCWERLRPCNTALDRRPMPRAPGSSPPGERRASSTRSR